jgi:hypothetical protein
MSEKMMRKARVEVTIHPLLCYLSQLIDEQQAFEARASNALECVRILVDRSPSVKKWTYDKEERLLPLIRFLLNGRKLRVNEFAKPLKDGDKLTIIFAPS